MGKVLILVFGVFFFPTLLIAECFSLLCLVYAFEVMLSERGSVCFYVYRCCPSSLNCYMSFFPLKTGCSTSILGENQQQEIQHNFTGLFHRNTLTFIYGFFLLMTILLIADQGNFSSV